MLRDKSWTCLTVFDLLLVKLGWTVKFLTVHSQAWRHSLTPPKLQAKSSSSKLAEVLQVEPHPASHAGLHPPSLSASRVHFKLLTAWQYNRKTVVSRSNISNSGPFHFLQQFNRMSRVVKYTLIHPKLLVIILIKMVSFATFFLCNKTSLLNQFQSHIGRRFEWFSIPSWENINEISTEEDEKLGKIS